MTSKFESNRVVCLDFEGMRLPDMIGKLIKVSTTLHASKVYSSIFSSIIRIFIRDEDNMKQEVAFKIQIQNRH